MKTTFIINDNASANNTFLGKSTNYSKILDDIIATNIAECNHYLGNIFDSGHNNDSDLIDAMIADTKKNSFIIDACDLLKETTAFTKAANFLANYKKNKKNTKKLPFIIGKTYKLTDGTPIIFYADEIQIGLDLYSYDDFADIKFISTLPKSTKKTIINIFGNSDINININ